MYAVCTAAMLFGMTGTLRAQKGDPFIETFRQGVLTMSKQTFEVVNSLHSVEDVDAAEPRFAKIMDDFVVMLNGLSEYLDQGFEGSLESLSVMETDAELKEWSDKVNASIEQLQNDHPEAAARLTELGNTQSQKVMEAMNNLMQKLMAQEMPAGDEPGTEAPGEYGGQ